MSTTQNKITQIPADGVSDVRSLPSDEFQHHKSGKAAKKQQNRQNLNTWGLKMFDDLYLGTYNHRMRRILKEQESRYFARGQQDLQLDRSTGIYSSVTQTPNSSGEYMPIGDQMMLLTTDHVGPAVKALLKELVASNPVFQAKPRNDTNEAAAAARIAQEFIDNDEAINANPDIRQDEALYGLICGNWFKETYYDSKAGGDVDQPDWGLMITPAQSTYQCADCQMTGKTAELAGPDGAPPPTRNVEGLNFVNAKCPQCQSDTLVEQTAPGSVRKVKTGSHKETVGIPISLLRDPSGIALKVNAKKIADSPFLYEESLVERCVLEAMFPWASIPSDPPSPALIAQYQLARATGSNSLPAYGGDLMFCQSGPFELIRFQRLWLDEIVYRNIESDRDITLGDPEKPSAIIKQGVALNQPELFPDGLRMYRVGQHILTWTNENKNTRWVHCGYIKNIDSIWCDGIVEKIVQPQKRGNVLSSLLMYSATNDSETQVVARRNDIDLNKTDNRPGRGLLYLEENFTGEDVTKAFGIIPGRDLTKTVPEERNAMWAEIEYISGAKPALQGNHDPGTNTYSEAAMERASAVGMLGPPSELRAQTEIERTYQVLELHQKYQVTGQHAFLGKYQNYELESFYNCDIHRDIEITYIPGSHMPRTQTDVMLAIQTIASWGGVPGGLLNAQVFPPKIANKIMEALHDPLHLDNTEPDKRNGEKRLRKLLDFTQIQLPQVGFDPKTPMPDPMIQPGPPGPDGQPTPVPTNPQYQQWQALLQATVAKIPFFPDTDNQQVFIDFYTEEFKADAIQDGGEFLQGCVLAILRKHKDVVAQAQQQAQNEQTKQMMVQQAGPALLQAQADDTELEKARITHAAQLQQVQENQQHEQAMQAAEHGHQQAMAMMQQGHEAVQNTQQQEHEEELADAQPDKESGE